MNGKVLIFFIDDLPDTFSLQLPLKSFWGSSQESWHEKWTEQQLSFDSIDSIYLYVPSSFQFQTTISSTPQSLTPFYLLSLVKVIMITLLSDHYVAQPVTVNDLQIASLALGFTVGFGFLTTWTAIRQTADIQRRYGYSRLNSPYVWMIWLEILVCLIFAVICWLHLNHIIPPRYLYCLYLLYSQKSRANSR